MSKAGVIGYPVSHSLSPRLHKYWLKHYNISGKYKAYAVSPAELGSFVRSLPDQKFIGCNVTLPHKETVIAFLDEISPLAKSIGAVNTIMVKDGKLHGYNTDVYGFMANIGPKLAGTQKAVVLGAGGAAKAVWNALKAMGFDEIVVSNRTESKLEMAEDCTIAPWEKRAWVLDKADLLVNATSLGLAGNDPLDIDLSFLSEKALVTDIVYSPLMTPLLIDAQARGNPVADGLGMLLHQGAPGFASWFLGRPMNEMPKHLDKPEVTEALRAHILAA